MGMLSRLAVLVSACIVAWNFSGEAQAGKPESFRYRYVSLDAAVPEGYFPFFDSPVITDSGRVYGTIYGVDPGTFVSAAAVYDRGTVSILGEGFASTANNWGVAGGGVTVDPELFNTQAALFTRNRVRLIEPVPGEFTSNVIRLTDSGIALIEWYPEDFSSVNRYLLWRKHVIPLDFGPERGGPSDVNNFGIMSGTLFRTDDARAFRGFLSGAKTLLEPLSTETFSYGLAINNRGDVLGYSFRPCGLERIGVWRGTRFYTYFVQGTPDFPIVSNALVWNERGLIVVSAAQSCRNAVSTDFNSYLVPRPGVRLSLAALTDGPLPVATQIRGINERGDMVGYGGSRPFFLETSFLLQRVGGDASDMVQTTLTATSSPPAVARAQGPMQRPPALERSLRQQQRDAVKRDSGHQAEGNGTR
jgi:hypothetical protein